MKKKLKSILASIAAFTTLAFNTNAFAQADAPHQERVLVILAEFTEPVLPRTESGWNSNYDGTVQFNDAYYNNLFFGSGRTIKDYFKENSNGIMNVIPAEETAGAVNDGIIRVKMQRSYDVNMVGDAGSYMAKQGVCIEATRLADQYFDASLYDQNGDGNIDSNELQIVVIAAGREGNPRLRGCWGFPLDPVFDNKNMTLCPSIFDSISSIGTIAHEMCHGKGGEDLYTFTNSGIGFKSIMSISSECTNLDPYHKIKMAFVDPIVVNQSGTYTVNSVNPNDLSKYNVLKIQVPNPYWDEYFLVENRQNVGLFDSRMFGEAYSISGGIGIWHVRAYDDPSIGLQDMHFEIADDSVINDLYSNEFYYVGDVGKTTFGPTTTPRDSKAIPMNTANGVLNLESGVTIKVNSTSSSSMNVTVNLLDKPSNITATSTGNSMLISWGALPLASEYEVSIDGGNYIGCGTGTIYPYTNDAKHKIKVRGLRSIGGSGADAVIQTAPGGIVYGDANLDGTVTSADTDLVGQYILGTATLDASQMIAADVNGTGTVNAIDKALITQFLNGQSTEFPV